MHVVSVNRVGLEQNGAMQFWGGSFVANPFGNLLYLASHDKEEVHVQELDIALSDRYRTHWPFSCATEGSILTSRSPKDLSTKINLLLLCSIKPPFMESITPAQLGYMFPAEFAPHTATWLSWPHKEASWPGKIHTIYPYYSEFVKELALSEKVRINVVDEAMQAFATKHLQDAQVDMSQVEFFLHPTNDAWCRDHGPAFPHQPRC